MADSGLLESLTAAHPAIGDLPALLEKLQRLDRLAIGTERAQHAAALLQRLARDGVHLEDPAVAADWLAPVLCVSARDRRALTERLLREAGKRSNAAPPMPRVIAASPLEAEAAAAGDAARRRRRIVVAVAAIVIAGLALLIALGGGGEGGAVVAGPTSLASGDLAAWLQILLPVLAAAAVFVVRRLAMAPPPITPPQRELPPTGQGLAWFDEGALQAPLRVMGRQRRAAGRQLDLQATIWRTVRRAGWPVVMRGGRARTPEHILLVQLANADDPRMLAAAALLDRLRGADLRVTAFLCSDGFRTLRPWGGGAPLALARIAALHRGARLLVVSDGAALHDPLANRVVEPPAFEAFALKALITPIARAAWSWREAALDRAGWRLTELSTDGVTELARWLSGPHEALPMLDAAASTGTSFIDLLTRDARLFRDDGALPAELRGRLLDRIATHLDPDPHLPPAAFDLLRVLAMGSELTPAAIERVAAHLSSLDGPRAEEAALGRLLALPWFTRGGLPVWLREDLLQALPAELAATGRDAWQLHLSGQPIGKGALTAEQSARIAAQSRLVLMQSYPADDVMRRVLELQPVAADWRSRLSEGAIATLLASGAGFGLWALAQLGPALARFAAMLFAPLAFLIDPTRPWLGLAAVLLAGGVFLPLERLAPGLRRVIIVAIGAAALLLAIGAVLPSTNSSQSAAFPAEDGYGGALAAVIGMLALRALLPWPASPIVTARALFVPGHPWWNAVPVLGIAAMSYAMMESTASPGGIPPWAMRELLCALGAAAIGAAIVARLRGVATIETRIGLNSAIAFVAGQAVGGGIATLLLGLAVAPRPEIPASLLLLARVAGGVACVAASLGTPIDARRLVALFAISIALPAFMFVLANAGYFGIDETYLGMQVIAAVLAMPMLWAWIAWPPPASTRRWGVLIVFGVLYLAGLVALMLSLDSGSPVVAAAVALPYLLVWPLLRISRTDLVTRGDGLWWRCLALAPCWIGLSVPTLGGGPFPVLAIPLAAWIAQRHGTRALPAIALALVPMTLGFDGFGLRLGGSLGHAFAALLVARFVADGEFRAACLAATRVAPWQLAALAILPLSYNSPRAFGFQIVIGAWPLVIALCVLIGLSRAPLRQPLLVLTGSSIAAFALTLIFGPYLSGDFGRLSHGLRNFPGDIITIMLALGLFRMLRGGAPLEPARALVVQLRDQPASAGAVIACVGYLVSVSWVVRADGESLSLLPFFATHFLLATLFWAAAGIAPARRPQIAIRGRDVPWTVILASLVLMVDLLPLVSVNLGAVRVSAFGRDVLPALGTAATVWAFHRLGQALARYPGVVAR